MKYAICLIECGSSITRFSVYHRYRYERTAHTEVKIYNEFDKFVYFDIGTFDYKFCSEQKYRQMKLEKLNNS